MSKNAPNDPPPLIWENQIVVSIGLGIHEKYTQISINRPSDIGLAVWEIKYPWIYKNFNKFHRFYCTELLHCTQRFKKKMRSCRYRMAALDMWACMPTCMHFLSSQRRSLDHTPECIATFYCASRKHFLFLWRLSANTYKRVLILKRGSLNFDPCRGDPEKKRPTAYFLVKK